MASNPQNQTPSKALVPYNKRSTALVPVGSLGDIEAFIRIAEKAPMLTAEEEKNYVLQLKDHNDLNAAQQLVLSHLRLVISIARGYLGYGLPHADLIQEGNIGLMKAIKRFEPDHGARLMTFASHWIRSEIQEYIIRNWRLVKLATTKNQRKLFFNLRQLKEDSQLALTDQQAKRIALTLNVKPQEVLDMDVRMSGKESSLESSQNDDEQSWAPIDWLTDKNDEPDIIVEKKDQEVAESKGLQAALYVLDDRSRQIIEARYLRLDESGQSCPATLQELADKFNISAERVRQIEKLALTKMKKTLSNLLP